MSKVEALLALVIMLLVLVLFGSACHIYDLNQEILEQRVSLFKACAEDYGVRNCHF